MPSGGTLTSTAITQVTTVLVVMWIDEGLGIDSRVRGKFRAVLTTKASWTGLGLPICKEIADSIGFGYHSDPGAQTGKSRESSFLW